MAWYQGGSVAAAVVIKVVLWSELDSLALGSGLCQVFGGIEGALIHKGGHRQFLPCMGVAFYPDSIEPSLLLITPACRIDPCKVDCCPPASISVVPG